MITWQDDRIGWGDASAQYLVDTTLRRVYRLGVNGAAPNQWCKVGGLPSK